MSDLQMARGPIVGGFNLAIGEPELLQEHLPFPAPVLPGPYVYPRLRGEEALLERLGKLYPGLHVVVANGAKHALLAAFHALRGYSVAHHVPYWPSYPVLAHMSGVEFEGRSKVQSWRAPGTVLCATSPNNPDGSETTVECDVWDAVYAHWVYGWSGIEPAHKVRIGSASKLLGLSGVRVGWLVTADTELAEKAAIYVERTTSGVSVPAQAVVTEALRCMEEHDPTPGFKAARSAMMENGFDFVRLMNGYCQKVRGVPFDGKGMFAWFQVLPDLAGERFERALTIARVALVRGEACGATEPGWYRMNMMARRETTAAALNALARWV
jgi:aspartate/methionine/tyrosine aminotransferase